MPVSGAIGPDDELTPRSGAIGPDDDAVAGASAVWAIAGAANDTVKSSANMAERNFMAASHSKRCSSGKTFVALVFRAACSGCDVVRIGARSTRSRSGR
jgi:hypothetical protein